MTTTREKQTAADPLPIHRGWIRRTLKWVALVVAVLIAGIAAYWVLAERGAVPQPAPITVAAPAQPAPTFDSNTADGCLGGPLGGDPAATVLAAHQLAALDPAGGAGFLLAFLRYGSTYPGDLQLATTLPQIVHPTFLPTALPGMTAHTADLASLGGASSTVANAADQWRVLSADPSAASITIGYVVYLGPHGAAQSTRMAGTFILDVVDGRWVIASSAPTPADPYAPIAGAPWASYAGVC